MNEAFDIWANKNDAASIPCSSQVLMVLSGVVACIKDHSHLETLTLQKLEVALSSTLPNEISLPLEVV